MRPRLTEWNERKSFGRTYPPPLFENMVEVKSKYKFVINLNIESKLFTKSGGGLNSQTASPTTPKGRGRLLIKYVQDAKNLQ